MEASLAQVEAAAGRTRLRKPARRRVIEDAASALFAEHGYAETRLEDIAAASGVSKQLLYQHFSSKKELHLALLAQHRDGLLGRLASGMSRPGPLAERLPGVIDDWFGYVEEHPYASAMLFRDTTGDPEVQAFYREIQATARRAIVTLIQREPEVNVANDRVEPLAEFLRAAITGVALWWSENPAVQRQTVVDVTLEALLGALELRRPGSAGRSET